MFSYIETRYRTIGNLIPFAVPVVLLVLAIIYIVILHIKIAGNNSKINEIKENAEKQLKEVDEKIELQKKKL